METDSFFWQLLKKLPETFFALVDQPLAAAADYRFEAIEVKKSYRLDGLFLPKKPKLPLYFVEVQYRRNENFYTNLFAKVLSYLDANNPKQEWMAVAIFPNREAEPKDQGNCEDLISSRRTRRIYLEDLSVPTGAPPGLTIIELATCPKSRASHLVSKLARVAKKREAACEDGNVIINLTEEILMRRFTSLSREEIRRMFKLHDIRKSRAWQEIHQEGREEGAAQERQKFARYLKSEGKSLKEIASVLETTLSEVRRLLRP